ncbi:MAG: hypothetical protein V2I24_11160, partial [Halieaceae bacterium]|nr:hypothetical protein [Halieaceae bacterium]
IRAAFHIGSHYELYQAEGVNPTVFSYIVGDVTIELARIVERALPGQFMLGDFGSDDGTHSSADFVRECAEAAEAIEGLSLTGRPLRHLRCWLTHGPADGDDELAEQPLDVTITDKHGLKHHAFNLQAELEFDDGTLSLGLTPEEFQLGKINAPDGGPSRSGAWWV